MRFMMIMLPNPKVAYTGEGIPDVEAVKAMTTFNQALVDSGALLSADGLHGPDKGFRIAFSEGAHRIIDGPFAEAKEVIGGYWIIQAKSRDEALSWAKQIPGSPGDVVEVRQIFDMEDFPTEIQDAARLDM